MISKKNKGEWTELFAFVKLLKEQNFPLSDSKLTPKSDIIKINKVTTKNINLEFYITNKTTIKSANKINSILKNIKITTLLSDKVINTLSDKIKAGKKTFEIKEFEKIQKRLGFAEIKGGKSNQKSDIVLDTVINKKSIIDEGWGIKSFLGDNPTLLNASSHTNFIFQIKNLDSSKVNEINNINSRTKIKDRIEKVYNNSADLNFLCLESDTMNYNLKLIDVNMPLIISKILLAFYKEKKSKIKDIVDYLADETTLLTDLSINNKQMLEKKIKDLLVAIMLGFFPGCRWDGKYESNGTIVVKSTGDIVGFHTLDLVTMKSYLYNNIKLETPSISKFKYATIYENCGHYFFKLNLQMRFLN